MNCPKCSASFFFGYEADGEPIDAMFSCGTTMNRGGIKQSKRCQIAILTQQLAAYETARGKLAVAAQEVWTKILEVVSIGF